MKCDFDGIWHNNRQFETFLFPQVQMTTNIGLKPVSRPRLEVLVKLKDKNG